MEGSTGIPKVGGVGGGSSGSSGRRIEIDGGLTTDGKPGSILIRQEKGSLVAYFSGNIPTNSDKFDLILKQYGYSHQGLLAKTTPGGTMKEGVTFGAITYTKKVDVTLAPRNP
ncbi:MAG: hypothetical protein PHH14_05920 [Candidatus Margulisbacteria bacterium]|nr:hypothetical protein [Candidatus Margulisiibacteriota bacterium]